MGEPLFHCNGEPQEEGVESLEEERRLLYVGMTRARKEELIGDLQGAVCVSFGDIRDGRSAGRGFAGAKDRRKADEFV